MRTEAYENLIASLRTAMTLLQSIQETAAERATALGPRDDPSGLERQALDAACGSLAEAVPSLALALDDLAVAMRASRVV